KTLDLFLFRKTPKRVDRFCSKNILGKVRLQEATGKVAKYSYLAQPLCTPCSNSLAWAAISAITISIHVAVPQKGLSLTLECATPLSHIKDFDAFCWQSVRHSDYSQDYN
ncbi:unnamed protein product, partial [Ixodes pacificus]